MRKGLNYFTLFAMFSFFFFASCGTRKAEMKPAFLATLSRLDSTLLTLQNRQEGEADYGALWCPRCKLYHSRAAEALYPFSYQYSLSGDTLYRDAAIRLASWLIRQQEEDGSWKETPEEWTGTTTDQLLMMALAWPLLEKELTVGEKDKWKRSMQMAGDYLVEVMDPGFASINYVATTAATMAVLSTLIPDSSYVLKARVMARQVVARMDDEHFLTGEGGRVDGIKYGVDITYNMEMSLWGLGLYSVITGDSLVYNATRASLDQHLHFIKPDGSLDGSWGIRSNKWTCYGGATSDGSQLLFSLFAKEDDRYRSAALRNLSYLDGCIVKGLLTYGPHHHEVVPGPPCIYPTFARAKNLAMAHAFCTADKGFTPPLPSDIIGMKYFPTLDVSTVRTEWFHGTITAYGYKDPLGVRRKYMFRPAGGALSNLWLKDYGFLQAASQTEYHRWEPMSFPVMPSLEPLTPGIWFEKDGKRYTNLYEFDASTTLTEQDGKLVVVVAGILKDREQVSSRVGYSYCYSFGEHTLEKRIRLHYDEVPDSISIIEPVIVYPGTRVVQTGPDRIEIAGEKVKIEFLITEGKGSLRCGVDQEKYRACYPALKGWPIRIMLIPEKGSTDEELVLQFRVMNQNKNKNKGV